MSRYIKLCTVLFGLEIVIVIWLKYQDLSLTTVIGITALLINCWAFSIPSHCWLRTDRVEKVKSELIIKTYHDESCKKIASTDTIETLHTKLNLVRKYGIAKIRIKDSEDCVDECQHAIIWMCLFNIFASLSSLYFYVPPSTNLSPQEIQEYVAMKSLTSVITLYLLLAVVSRYTSLILLHRKRNGSVE